MNDHSSHRPVRHRRPEYPLNVPGDTVLGSDSSFERPLPRHQRIADRHLIIRSTGDRTQLRDLGAGTNVNGRWVIGRTVEIRPGDEIDVGPLALRFTGTKLESVASMSQVQLTVRNVSHTGSDRGGPKPLLQDVSLVLMPGEFVCFLGPSGCGKSILMRALSGRAAPNGPDSVVQFNHRNLYTQFEQLKQNLVLVPQRTVVHGDLTVKEALHYTAKLRLPPTADAAARIRQLIEQMKLEETVHTQVKRLSGGQEKRLCLANELMSDPGLIFLDEVTSGLDELTDRDMMRLFRGLADGGKTVACITHSLAHVMQTCHLVVVLAPGGRPVFIGPPARALTHFEISELSEVYGLFGNTEKEQKEKVQRFVEKFKASEEYQEYIANRLPLAVPEAPSRSPSALRDLPAEFLVTGRQTTVLTRRSLRILRRDRAVLGSLVGQALLVAMILIGAFGAFGDFPLGEESPKPELGVTRLDLQRMDYIRKLLNLTFLLGVTSFWFGCNNAAKEMVRERTITVQERMFNLRPIAYFSSKLLILSVVSCFQATALLLIVWGGCGPPGDRWEFLPVILGLAFVGTTLGLAISALSPSESVAVAMIPIAVIPQIILSGAIVSLTGATLAVGELLVTTYWGKLGLDALVSEYHGEFARRKSIQLIESTATWPTAIAMGIHACVFCLFAVAGLAADGSFPGAIRKLSAWLARFLPAASMRT